MALTLAETQWRLIAFIYRGAKIKHPPGANLCSLGQRCPIWLQIRAVMVSRFSQEVTVCDQMVFQTFDVFKIQIERFDGRVIQLSKKERNTCLRGCEETSEQRFYNIVRFFDEVSIRTLIRLPRTFSF